MSSIPPRAEPISSPAEPISDRRPTTPVRVTVLRGGQVSVRPDRVVTEEPLEVRVSGRGQQPLSVAVTMRTPGADFDLAVGLLRSEGLITERSQVAAVRYCLAEQEPQRFNVVSVELTVEFAPRWPTRRFLTSSSCGVCGKALLDELEVACPRVGSDLQVQAALISSFAETLRSAQPVFKATGGLHAAALYDRSGQLVASAEDVGRHNAVDKLVGRSFLAGRLPLSNSVLVVSGRAGFEIVQKAAVAGIPVLAAVSAPSSLAVSAGERLGVTVVGFLRDGGFNIYSHPQRIALESPEPELAAPSQQRP